MTSRAASPTTRYALPISLAVVAAYLAYFFVPAARSSESFGRGQVHGDMDSMAAQLATEAWLAASVLALIFLLRWVRPIRLGAPVRLRALWWALPPLLFTGAILAAGLAAAAGDAAPALPRLRAVLAVVATVALVGLFEELLFRGILFHGLETSMGPTLALVGSSILFGLMHYVNWVGGQPLGDTTAQVLHAGADGFLYGALMLMTGTIWVPVLLHAAWDGTVSVVASVNAASAPGLVTQTAAAPATGGEAVDLILLGFEPIYGLIVFAAWLVLRRRGGGATVRPRRP